MFDIDEARRICDAATPGPWKYTIPPFSHGPCDGKMVLLSPDETPFAESDMRFIAYARTALPAAIEEIERLRAAITKHHGQVGDDRCKHDDDELYAAIGLGPPDRTMPPRCEFLAECERFYDNRCDESVRPSYRRLLEENQALRLDIAALRSRLPKSDDGVSPLIMLLPPTVQPPFRIAED